jgi:hypothetical protein
MTARGHASAEGAEYDSPRHASAEGAEYDSQGSAEGAEYESQGQAPNKVKARRPWYGTPRP